MMMTKLLVSSLAGLRGTPTALMRGLSRRSVLGSAVVVAAVLGLASPLAAAGDRDPDTLKVALLPDENASTVIQNNEGLKKYLEATLNKQVELVVTTDYSSMIEAMRFGRLDLAYFGPASYTIAKDRMAGGDFTIEPFAGLGKNGTAVYQSVLIANADTDIRSIEDIKKEKIDVAFGDQASTSSHFAPKFVLKKAGIEEGVHYRQNFTGAHDAVAKNVELGNAQVGGLSRPIFESLIERGIIDESKIRVLQYSDDIPQYPWVMRTDLTPELQEAIRGAFLNLDKSNPEHEAVLKPFKADQFLPMDDAAYDIIRDMRASLGLS